MMKKVRSFLCLVIAVMLFMTSFPVANLAIEAKAETNGYYTYVVFSNGLGNSSNIKM